MEPPNSVKDDNTVFDYVFTIDTTRAPVIKVLALEYDNASTNKTVIQAFNDPVDSNMDTVCT